MVTHPDSQAEKSQPFWTCWDAESCPIHFTLSRIGGKWKPMLLYLIDHGCNRFGLLGQALPRISKKILTEQLRELERDGLLHRQVFLEVPTRVEYSLTPIGETLRPVLLALYSWGQAQTDGSSRER